MLKRMMTAAAAVCFVTGMLFCVTGCGGKSGTSYQYEETGTYPFTDTYNLFDDGTFKREYDGTYISSSLNVSTQKITLESGTYTTTSTGITFNVENSSDSGVWDAVLAPHWYSGSYNYKRYGGTFNEDVSIVLGSRITYKKKGSVFTSGN